MKKLIVFWFLLLCSIAINAQTDIGYMILDDKVVTKEQFDSSRLALQNQVINPNRLSVVEYSERADRCLCVEFYSVRPEGINLHRDCQDNSRVAFSSETDILTVIKNSKIVQYYIVDPVTGQQVHPSNKYVSIFEIDPANASQGLKHWNEYPDGSTFSR